MLLTGIGRREEARAEEGEAVAGMRHADEVRLSIHLIITRITMKLTNHVTASPPKTAVSGNIPLLKSNPFSGNFKIIVL